MSSRLRVMITQRIPWSWVVIVVGGVLMLGMSSLISLNSAQRAIRESEEASRQASEQSRQIVCTAIIAQDEVANDPDAPPVTERAKNAASAWHELRQISQCDRK